MDGWEREEGVYLLNKLGPKKRRNKEMEVEWEDNSDDGSDIR